MSFNAPLRNRTAKQAPWLKNRAWEDGKIHSSNRPMAIIKTVFYAVFNLAIWTAVHLTSDEYLLTANGLNVWVLIAILTAIAASLVTILHTFLFWRHALTYGGVVFQMSHVPGEIGGSLAGVITMTPRERPRQGLHLSLSCNHAYNDSEETLWRDACPVLIPEGPGELRIPVFFRIPADCESSRESEIIWRLELKERSDDEDTIASFVVPVFY